MGLIVASALRALGEFSNGEPMEGVMYLATPLSLPVGSVLATAGLGSYADTWIAFIAVAIPLNAALWGAVVAVVRAAWTARPPTRPPA